MRGPAHSVVRAHASACPCSNGSNFSSKLAAAGRQPSMRRATSRSAWSTSLAVCGPHSVLPMRARPGCETGSGFITSLSTASWLAISLKAASSRASCECAAAAPRICEIFTPNIAGAGAEGLCCASWSKVAHFAWSMPSVMAASTDSRPSSDVAGMVKVDSTESVGSTSRAQTSMAEPRTRPEGGQPRFGAVGSQAPRSISHLRTRKAGLDLT